MGFLLYHTPDVNLMLVILKCSFSAKFTFSNVKYLAHKSGPSVSTSFVFLGVWGQIKSSGISRINGNSSKMALMFLTFHLFQLRVREHPILGPFVQDLST